MNIGTSINNSTKPFYSLEFFPPKNQDQWPNFFSTVERLTAIKPLFTSVTYGAGGSTQDYTIEITAKLKNMGLEPMAHLTCVGATPESLNHCLQRLSEAGVENVLALRGDAPVGQTMDWATADFQHAADLVRFTRRGYPHMGVAVAGYPAPHPESKSFVMDRVHTLEKVRSGADFVVTQLFFDVREYFDLVDFMRRQNVTVPVIPGILPVQSFDSVRRVLSMCGGNIPGKLYLDLEAAHEKGGVEAVRQVGLRFAVQQIRELIDGGAPGIHLYTLNRASLCLELVDAVGLK